MQKTHVTQKQWKAVMGNNPSRFKEIYNPVDSICWNECKEFLAKLNILDPSRNYRLPNEAEYEYCCRAGTTTYYFFGDDESELDQYAWYYKNSNNTTHHVGTKKPNPFGLFDMIGNVWCWCEDLYDVSGSRRVVRGGCWRSYPANLRSAQRSFVGPAYRFDYVGFRLVRDLPLSLLPLAPLQRACDSREQSQKLIRQIRAKLRKLEDLL